MNARKVDIMNIATELTPLPKRKPVKTRPIQVELSVDLFKELDRVTKENGHSYREALEFGAKSYIAAHSKK